MVASGTPQGLSEQEGSLTGDYLSGRREIEIPATRHKPDKKRLLTISGATGNNLKEVDLELPAGLFVCVTGVSGSGKSTLINETLYKLTARELNNASAQPAPHQSFSGKIGRASCRERGEMTESDMGCAERT